MPKLFVPLAQANSTLRWQNAPYAKAASRPQAVHEFTLVHAFTASIDKKMDFNNFQILNPNSFLKRRQAYHRIATAV